MLCLWRTSGPSITLVSQQEIGKLGSFPIKNIPVGGGVEYLQVESLKEELLVWDLSTLEVRKIFWKMQFRISRTF